MKNQQGCRHRHTCLQAGFGIITKGLFILYKFKVGLNLRNRVFSRIRAAAAAAAADVLLALTLTWRNWQPITISVASVVWSGTKSRSMRQELVLGWERAKAAASSLISKSVADTRRRACVTIVPGYKCLPLYVHWLSPSSNPRSRDSRWLQSGWLLRRQR